MAVARHGADVVVVGAGIMGLATAWQLSRHGVRTMLLERFDALHTRGSSHGDSRIIRPTYPQAHYARAMTAAYELWEEIQRETGEEVLRYTGGLDIAPHGTSALQDIVRNCDDLGVDYEVMDERTMSAACPDLRLAEGCEAVFTPKGGVLHADRARALLLGLAVRAGCDVRHGGAVAPLRSKDGSLIVEVAGGTRVEAPTCVVTCGAWVAHFCSASPAAAGTPFATMRMHPKRVTSHYWGCHPARRVPVLVDYTPGSLVYGLQEADGRLKVSWHDGVLIPGDPDDRDQCDDSHLSLPPIRRLMAAMLPWAPHAQMPTASQPCMYTMTADQDFVLDAADAADGGRIVVGAGFSGHGFKLAPWVGGHLAHLAAPNACPAVLPDADRGIFAASRAGVAHAVADQPGHA